MSFSSVPAHVGMRGVWVFPQFRQGVRISTGEKFIAWALNEVQADEITFIMAKILGLG